MLNLTIVVENTFVYFHESSDFVLGELLLSIKELVSVVRDSHASTISAISRGMSEHRSRSIQRDSFRDPRLRSQSRDSELLLPLEDWITSRRLLDLHNCNITSVQFILQTRGHNVGINLTQVLRYQSYLAHYMA